MDNPWDKMPQAHSASELNPLTNPLLQRNLERWARVYFSNPPAKREKAVSHLLQEIKLESGAESHGDPSLANFSGHVKIEGAVCSACQHQNPPGHKFCSGCGKTLNAAKSESRETLAAPALSEAPRSGEDAQWLRENTLVSMNESAAPLRQTWKYMVGAAAIVLAGFAYMQWGSETRQNPGPSAAITDSQMSSAAAPRPDVSSPAEAPAETPAEAQDPPEKISPEFRGLNAPNTYVEAPNRTGEAKGLQPAAEKSTLLDATSPRPTISEKESGLSDLRLAQRYLAGSMGARDSSEAAKLLWKAVGKQNATAALLLSDLYLRGDGVPRSCAQAGILLAAAAKRGSTQAAQQLETLESQGCH